MSFIEVFHRIIMHSCFKKHLFQKYLSCFVLFLSSGSSRFAPLFLFLTVHSFPSHFEPVGKKSPQWGNF